MANLLSNLVSSKPKWQSDKAEVRLAAVAELDPATEAEHAEAIQALAANDPDNRVQSAAIAKLSDPALLASLAAKHKTDVLSRLRTLLTSTDTTNKAEPLLAEQSNPEILFALLNDNTLSQPTRALAAQQLSDKQRVQCLLKANETDGTTQQILFAAINDFAALSELLNDSHVDQSQLHQKLDQLAQQSANQPNHNPANQAPASLADQRGSQIIDALDAIIKHGSWDSKREQIDNLRTSWQAIVAKTSSEVVERMARTETMLAATMSAKQDLAARSQPSADVLAIKEQKTAIGDKLEALVTLLTARTEGDLSAEQDELHALTAQWKTLDSADPYQDELEHKLLAERFAQTRQQAEERLIAIQESNTAGEQLQQWLTKLQQKDSIKDVETLKTLRSEFKQLRRKMLKVPSAWIEQGESDIKRLQGDLVETEAAAEDQIKAVKATVAELQRCLKEGESSKAAQLYQTAKRQISQAPLTPAAKKNIEAKLNTAKRDLKEINKWAHWAHNRDRRQLCEELESLAKTDAKNNVPPEEKLEKLQAARQQWKALEAAEFTEQEHAAGKDLWGRFNAAASKVYKACEDYVKKRDAQRSKQLKQAEANLKTAATFTAAEQNNDDEQWREVSKAANHLRRTLRSLNDLPPEQRGSTAKAIKTTLNDLNGPLSEWQQRNAKRKQRIIEMAKLAVKERELDTALQKIKSLQNDWKQVPPANRKEEQKLWDEFKAHSDEVYGRLNEKRNSERAELNQVFDSLRQALQEANNALQGPDDALDDAKAIFKKSESVFDEHDVRHKVADAIRRDFERSKKQLQQRLQKRRRQAEQQTMQKLIDCATLLNRVETEDAALADVQSEIDSAIAALDEKLAKKMQRRVQNIADSAQFAANQSELETLALQMEITADVETPAAFKADRMALQVQRLSNAFGGAKSSGQANTAPQSLAKLQQTWHTIGPVSAEARQQLEKRFAAVQQANRK